MQYLRLTGRDETHVDTVEAYLKAQGMFGIPRLGEVEYSDVLEIDLGDIEPSIAGPKRPQDRIALADVKQTFNELLTRPVAEDGFGVTEDARDSDGITHGSVVISAITSCTNTSNPSVMIGAGLLAKKAVEKGLRVPDYVKTSLAPGSPRRNRISAKHRSVAVSRTTRVQRRRLRMHNLYREQWTAKRRGSNGYR